MKDDPNDTIGDILRKQGTGIVRLWSVEDPVYSYPRWKVAIRLFCIACWGGAIGLFLAWLLTELAW